MAERGKLFRFDDFLLDKQARALDRVLPDGGTIPIQVGSRALHILCLLVEGRGQIITSRQIMDAVWPDVAVEQNNLTVQISALRRALDAGRTSGSCIQNISGRGYRLFPTVTEVSSTDLSVPGTAPPTDGHVAVDQGAGDAVPGGQPETGTTQDAAPAMALPSTGGTASHRGVWLALSGACVAALAGAVLWSFDSLGTSRVAAVTPRLISAPADRPRLSLVVLPFRNLGGEGMDDATVEAITEDLTSDLARVYGLFVIGRSSAFSYKGKPIDIKQVGDELGVRYVVEGSVRKSEGTLRVNVRLVATETGSQVWGDHFGIARDGISYSVDDIVRQIAHALSDRLAESESSRSTRERPTNPDVIDLMLRARALQGIPPNPQRQSEIVALYERAVELDALSATALAGLSESLLDSIYTYEDPTTPEIFRRVEELVLRAERLRPYDMPVMYARMLLLMSQRRCADVIPAAHRMIAVYPNVASSHKFLGICLMFDGRATDAIPKYEQTIRLDPRNAWIYNRYELIGYALLFLDRYDEAVVWFQKALAANPNASSRSLGKVRAAIAAAQALAGHDEEARASAGEAARLLPTLTARGYYRYKLTNPVNAAQVSRMRDGLRLAGIRDHADEDADTLLPADGVLHTDYEAPTPISVSGARTIRTPDLAALVKRRRPLIIDTNPWGSSIPDAVGLWGAGIGGALSDEFQARLGRKMLQLTGGDRTVPLVAMDWNAERFQGRNLALRLVALGYTEVYWYRGGRESWQVAGLPLRELVMQDW